MDITSVITSISMMGIIVLLGALVGRRLSITDEAKQLLMMIIINLAVPAIIFNGIFSTEIDDALLGSIITIFCISVVVNILGIVFGLVAARLTGFKSMEAKKIAVLAGLGNSGFIGIPLCAQLFGPVGGLLAAIFDAGLDVVVFSVVIMMLQQGAGFSIRQFKSLINVPFIAIITGIIVAIIGVEPPIIIKDLAAFLSSIAAPLAMIYIGILIPDFLREKKKTPFKFISVSLVVKLIIFPLAMIAVIQLFPLDEIMKKVIFVLVAMPTIMMAPVLLSRYANDEDAGVMTTIYSTILSLITIPVIVYISNYFL